MKHRKLATHSLAIGSMLYALACGGSSQGPGAKASGSSDTPDSNEFQTRHSSSAGSARGATASKIKATPTHAAMKFFVVDKVKDEPVPGIVISMEAPDGLKYFTAETDSMGYGEVLVPAGQAYKVLYLSLGPERITAKVKVSDEPMQNIKLTLRYKPWVDKSVIPVAGASAALPPDPKAPAAPPPPVFRLDGVNFGSASSELQPESYERLDKVVEYLTYKPTTRLEIAGHTDNVGSSKKNQVLSFERAEACRLYFIGKGIDAERIDAVGYGDRRPVASNDTEEGRLKNRRIEARELRAPAP